jgi:hypothetical protein
MRKLSIFALFFIFVPLSSASQGPSGLPASVKRWTFGIGPEIYYFQYREPGLMKDKGMFYGVAGAYTYRGWIPENPEEPFKEDKWMFGIEGRFAYGRVDYDGSLWDGTPYKVDNIEDLTTEFRFLLGPDFPKENGIDTIYAGFGFRYLDDKGSKDPAGYDRESTYCYIPIGLRADRLLKDGWSVGATGEFDLFLVGDQKSHLGDVGLIDVENRQNSGYGLRGSVRFEKQCENSSFTIEPFIRYWNIARSEDDELDIGFEPKNNTTECGVRLIWTF